MADARWAVCVPDGYADLLPSGSGTSSFTQADPRPGIAVPRDAAGRFRVTVSGAQETDLAATVLRPGFVRSDAGGLAIAYSLDGDDAWRGWSPANIITGWTSDPTSWAAAGGITLDPAESAIATNPITGRIVIVAGENGVTSPRTMRYNPRDDTWDTGTVFSSQLPLPAALAYDPDTAGRLLLWGADQVSYYSDDDGDTWQLHSLGGWDGSAPDPRVAAAPGGLWLATANDALWTSTTRGVTWEEQEDLSTFGSQFVPLRTPGGWVVVYVSTASDLCCRLLPYTRPVFSEADEVVIDAGTYTQVDATADADGRIWVVGGVNAPARTHTAFVSATSGATWGELSWGILGNGGGDSGLGAHRLTASCGSIWLMSSTATSGGTTPTTDRLHLLRLGGWGTLESGPGMTGTAAIRRFGYGAAPGGGQAGLIGAWFPVDEPDDAIFNAWTVVGAAGGTWVFGDFGDLGGELTDNGEHRYRAEAGGSFDTQAGEAICRVVGPVVGTAGSPTSRMSVQPELADGAYRYRVSIRFGTDGIRVVDEGGAGASLGLATLDGTVKTYVRWHLTLGKVWVWWKQGAGTAWTVLCGGVTVTDEGASAVAADRLTFGLDGLGSAVTASHWYFVGAAGGAAWHTGLDGAGEQADGPEDRALGLRYGRLLAPGIYPVPDAAPADGPLTWIAGLGGPGYVAETVDVPVRYGAGVDRLDPRASPSPRAAWESTDGSVAQVLEWDAELARYRGGALALVAAGLRAEGVTLAYHNGTTWVPVGAINGCAATYTRTGRTIRPATATTGHLHRYLWEGELVGGWVRLEDGAASGTYYYAEIVAQSAGWWDPTAGLQQATITIAEVPSGYTGTGGGVTLFHHAGVDVVDLGTIGSEIRRLRVTFQAFTVENPPTHRAGVLTPSRVVGVSAPVGWRWERRLELTRRVERTEDGVTQSTTLGPPRAIWVSGWAEDGVALGILRDGSAATTLESGTGQVGSAEDPWTLWGLLERGLLSGEVPCVVLAAPDAVEISDPSLWVWARVTSDAYSVSGVLGVEGANEMVRVDGLTVEQIR